MITKIIVIAIGVNKMNKHFPKHILITIAFFVLIFTGCTASQHLDNVRSDDEEKFTVGIVQKEIMLGMSGDQVISILGSPNIVTTDENRRESWVYDKIYSEVAYSKSNGTIIGLIFGSSGGGLGIGSYDSGAEKTSQRTLTVIIKFDETNRVRDFAYHASRF